MCESLLERKLERKRDKGRKTRRRVLYTSLNIPFVIRNNSNYLRRVRVYLQVVDIL